LREQLAAEVARLASEREAMQARWNAAAAELARQINGLHEEAAQLAREREALAGARSQFLDERNAHAQELADRSSGLRQLEAELARATAALGEQLRVAQQQRDARDAPATVPQPAGATASPGSADSVDFWAAEVAPAAIIAGTIAQWQDYLTMAAPQIPPIIADTWQPDSTPVADSAAALATEKPATPQSGPLEHLQAQWEETSERLRVQIEQLQAESAELTNQRLALEQSRQDWQSEREALTSQLAVRAEQLARLEADLAATTAALQERLAEAEARQAEEAARAREERIREDKAREERVRAEAQQRQSLAGEWLDQLAPAAIVAGLDAEGARDLAVQLTPEVALSFAPDDSLLDRPTEPSVQAELQARWEATSQQLVAQVDQLRAEAAQMAADREAMMASRDVWRGERDLAREQFALQQRALADQQAELAATVSLLAAKLSDVEQRLQPTSPPPEGVAAELADTEATPPPPPLAKTENGVQGDRGAGLPPTAGESSETPCDVSAFSFEEVASGEEAETLAQSPRGEATFAPASDARRRETIVADTEQLTVLLTSRVGAKYDAPSRRWLWWSAGGIAAVVVLTLVVAGVLWGLKG
jgi:hypothetical protein